MKNKICVVVLVLCFCAATKANAQARTKRFCEISFNPADRYFQIDYGKTSKTDPFKDAAFIKKLKGIERIHNFIKGLNYMSNLGWKLEANLLYNSGSGTRVLFSREFNPDELIDDSGESEPDKLDDNRK